MRILSTAVTETAPGSEKVVVAGPGKATIRDLQEKLCDAQKIDKSHKFYRPDAEECQTGYGAILKHLRGGN